MLKGKGDRNGRPIILLGLSHKNLENLKRDDDMIYIWKDELGIDFDIVIFSGETEDAMAEMVRNPNTVIHGDPRQPKPKN